jgi:hypothetical protein
MPRRSLLTPLQPLLFRPAESETGFDFGAVLNETRAVWFPELGDEVEVRIGAHGPLAFVSQHVMGVRRHVVVFHSVLNQAGVPVEVIRFLSKHELTHIVTPPVLEPWGWESHHEGFWRHERAVGPEHHAVWSWLYANLRPVLTQRRQGIGVYSTWRRRAAGLRLGPYMPNLPFEEVPWERLCPEGGAQLRLPPEWTWRPNLAAKAPALSPFAVPPST